MQHFPGADLFYWGPEQQLTSVPAVCFYLILKHFENFLNSIFCLKPYRPGFMLPKCWLPSPDTAAGGGKSVRWPLTRCCVQQPDSRGRTRTLNICCRGWLLVAAPASGCSNELICWLGTRAVQLCRHSWPSLNNKHIPGQGWTTRARPPGVPLSLQPDSRTSLRLNSLGSETRSHPLNIEYCAALIVSTAHLEVAGQMSSCCPPHLLLGLPTLCSLQSPPALRHTNNQQTGGSVGHDFWVPLMKHNPSHITLLFYRGLSQPSSVFCYLPILPMPLLANNRKNYRKYQLWY